MSVKSFPKPKSLQNLLFLHFFSAAFIPLVLFSIIALLLIGGKVKESVQEENGFIAMTLVKETEIFLQEIDKVEEWLVDGLELVGKDTNEGRMLLEETRADFSFFESFQILNRRGDVLYTSPYNEDLIGSNMSSQRFFTVPLNTGEPFWSSPFLSSSTREITIAVSRPIENGVLVGYINLPRLGLLPGNVEKFEELEGVHILITDADGRVISYNDQEYVKRRRNIYTHPVIRKTLEGETGTYETKFDGEKMLASSSVIDRTGWPVVVMQRRSEAYQMLDYVMWTGLILALFALLLSALLAYFGRNRIMAPLYSLSGTFTRISSGDYRIRPDETYPEMVPVVRSVEQMSREIELREEALRESEEKYRQLVQNAASIIVRWDAEFKILFFNEYAEKLWGVSAEDVVGLKLNETKFLKVKEKDESVERYLSRVWNYPGKFTSAYFTHYISEGRTMTIHWSHRPVLDKEGGMSEVLSVGVDVTDLIETRRELESSLQEKNLLLKEVHHRVKNNLQLILSLLNLKLEPRESGDNGSSLLDSMGHIYAIAQVHEQLYQSEKFTDISLQEYLEKVVAYAFNLREAESNSVSTKVIVEDVHVDIDRAIPAGIIVYELVTNSLAHAGFDRTGGEIRIEGEVEGGRAHLLIRDTGSGFAPRLFENPSSVGFTLVTELVKQLGGRIEYSGENGSRFDLYFDVSS